MFLAEIFSKPVGNTVSNSRILWWVDRNVILQEKFVNLSRNYKSSSKCEVPFIYTFNRKVKDIVMEGVPKLAMLQFKPKLSSDNSDFVLKLRKLIRVSNYFFTWKCHSNDVNFTNFPMFQSFSEWFHRKRWQFWRRAQGNWWSSCQSMFKTNRRYRRSRRL